ncbi:c-type cytochrome [Ramlibacter henchirensis]|uniref:C-type cytochrome n=1 Tax=Ramlibacter henchirensis TaxID=204072 RepID=A0A4Z0C685_9BURK|nr:cytochrome c [Ramlibacter henchirensis]TFZ07186.1 c-type cytochrome [Ramlibacter henchirensis]
MNKWIKRGGIAVAALAVLAGGAVFAGLRMADSRMQRTVDVKVQPVALRSDAASIERGKYLFNSRGCIDCHGADGAGRTFVEKGDDLKIKGPNITLAPGTAVANYQPLDWVRAIRHGIAPSGRPLLVMPSEDYNRFTDDDLAALVAYVRSLPPAQGTGAEIRLPLPVRVLYGFGAIPDAASRIDHSLPPQQPIPEAVTVQHGAYVANMCLGCHGEKLAGGKVPGGPPEWPAAANLTPGPGSIMQLYPDADSMLKMFRTGKRPDGSEVQVMPFGSLKNMSETDVRALHLYLRTLAPLPKG